ncbi:unnamed protein product, partial [Notodromas monacha]
QPYGVGVDYSAYFAQQYYDPNTYAPAQTGNQVQTYYNPSEYTLETQRLVSSSDRMSYQSSQQSDTNSSHSDTKKFVHFSADTLSAGGGVHNYGYPGNQQQLQQTQQP